LTGNIPIARIVYEGEEQFDVYVDTLVNSKGDDISPINPAYDKERSPVSSSTKPNTDSTQEPTGVTQTVATATASQTLSPQATGTIPLSSGDTPTASVHQNTDDFSSSDSFESAPVDTVGPGTSVQTQATKSPLIPILVVLAFAVALVGLRKCA
jgi:activator of HSP90 ATPase